MKYATLLTSQAKAFKYVVRVDIGPCVSSTRTTRLSEKMPHGHKRHMSVTFNFGWLSSNYFYLVLGEVQWTLHHVLPKNWHPSPKLQVVQQITSQAETPTAWKNIKFCICILFDWQKRGKFCSVFILRYVKDNLHIQRTILYTKRVYSVIQPQSLSL